ncbi:DUF3108 domain-containing protein [Burkholderia plantarii]|uniref:DUF3108 domain-containing protein n=1 Tax=Burkholderia plantarii TaxID=41899 RepID=UPI0018DD760C|nr:DUF3108 domain-containing protein [Burkholderia plantarii]MBI0327165.1 DUF3108 domain-containing protein [Burkholderia plantarii]
MPPLPPTNSSGASPRRLLRIALTLAVVLLLHGLVALWFAGYRASANPSPQDDTPVQVELLKPQPIERAPAPASRPPQPRPRPAASPATHPAPAPRPSTAPAPEHAPVLTATQPSSVTTSPAMPSAETGAGAGAGNDTAAASNAAAPAAPASAPAPGVKFVPPPPGDLHYGAYFNGNLNGTATIHWVTDGRRYRLAIDIPVPFVGPYTYESLGRIDGFGIAPDRYTEQRGRRPADIAIFNRDTKQIVFTKTPNSIALPDGAQDRFSLLMQLSGLVHGAPDSYRPGVAREFLVVDNDSGETWPIVTIGDESIRTDAGPLQARHFRRLPRRAGDTRRIDIWLAPSLDWLPVRLVQTEPNGSEIELLWQGRSAATAQLGYDEGATREASAASAVTVPASAAPAPAPGTTPSPASGTVASPPQAASGAR